MWDQLEITDAHVAYACIGIFSSIFSLVSLFIKERLYLGESSIAVIFGFIVGPYCLRLFDPISWSHSSDSLVLEVTRIILCLQIFAVAVELPKKYMRDHWISLLVLLLPVMTVGWIIVAGLIKAVVPSLNFKESMLISACITATDPILAQSVVSGKFAERVPGHLRNLLSAESGCNDGMAFPFIFLSLSLMLYENHSDIAFNWIFISLTYKCIFGCLFGVTLGYLGRLAIRYASKQNIIDRESFLVFYVVLTFLCVGLGSMLGLDDLLVSFAAGTAFAWDGWFADKTEQSNVSTVIDLLLNYAYFVFFGAIIPWQHFYREDIIGTNFWKLMLLTVLSLILRRIPTVLLLKPLIPDLQSWREALFVGHFGPIGVGAVFAAMFVKQELLHHLPENTFLIHCVWAQVCFFIITSIVVHGSSVAMITLGKHLNTITLTKTITLHTGSLKPVWLQRLPSKDEYQKPLSIKKRAPFHREKNVDRFKTHRRFNMLRRLYKSSKYKNQDIDIELSPFPCNPAEPVQLQLIPIRRKPQSQESGVPVPLTPSYIQSSYYLGGATVEELKQEET